MKYTKVVSGLIFIGLLAGFINTLGIRMFHDSVSLLLSSPMFTIFLGIAFISFLVSCFITRDFAKSMVIAGALLTIGFLFVPFQNFINDKAIYEASATTKKVDADSLSYAERVPFEVVGAVSNRSLGDTQGDSTGYIKSVPTSNTYTTSVIRRGFFKGYESVQVMNLPMYGSFNFKDNIKFCQYSPDASRRLNGMGFNNNMEMIAYHKVSFWNPTINISQDDAFSLCENDTPMLYMPATKIVWHGLSAYRVPAGVVKYNGKTGEMTYQKNMKVNGLAVYPISLAYQQRESTKASGGFIEYIRGVVGYEDTTKDGNDPNSANATEFVLSTADKKNTQFVTPLTPRGNSTSVVGLSTVDSQSNTYGKLNPLVIHTYESPRQAPSTIASDLISTKFEGYKAEGLTVFEVIPSENGKWTVSVGKNQSILYRAIIDSNGKVESMTNANEADPAVIDKSSPTQEATSLTSKPINEMSVDELQQLSEESNKELADRARQAEQG